jgi:hypothetical protein
MATSRLPQSVFRSQNREHRRKMAEFLATGDLNKIGTKRFNPTPLTFDALEEVLVKYGELLVKGFQDELNKSDANASGAGSSSIRFEFEKLGNNYEVAIFMSDYLKYVDEGVQGINKGRNVAPNSPFKFKFKNPSKSHVEALEKWIKEKNVTALITAPKGISQKTSNKSLAYAIGYSIKQRGIRSTYFKKKTVEKIIDDMKAEIALAAGNDMRINILF